MTYRKAATKKAWYRKMLLQTYPKKELRIEWGRIVRREHKMRCIHSGLRIDNEERAVWR